MNNNFRGVQIQPTPYIPTIPPPRHLPINVPFSNFGITVVTMDKDGNITIKVEQPLRSPQDNAHD